MKRDRSWPNIRALLNAEAMGSEVEPRLAGVIMDLTARVDREAEAFVAACIDAEEVVARARANAEEFLAGGRGKPGLNTLGILQSRSGDMDRAAMRLEESLEMARRLAYVVGIETTINA